MFITNNKEKSLKKQLNTLIQSSEELKFLVDFFYFSGIKELYETLKSLYENNVLKASPFVYLQSIIRKGDLSLRKE